MALSLDIEIAEVLAAAEAGGQLPVTPRGDAMALRDVIN